MLTAWSAYVAYPYVNVGFATYDDEGYMLAILDGTARGGDLYDAVYSQYGPFFSTFLNVVFAVFDLPTSHDAGRAVAIGFWVLAALLAGLATKRATRSRVAGIVAQLTVFGSLARLAVEPLHPVSLIAFLLAAVVLATTFLDTKPRQAGVALGVLVGCLILTKVNIGVLVLLSLAVALLLGSGRAARPRWFSVAFALLFVAAPFALVGPDFEMIRNFTVLVACAAASVVVAAGRGSPSTLRPEFPHRIVWAALAAFTATIVVVCGYVVASGTSLRGLVWGVVIEPLGQREVLFLPMLVPWTAVRAGIAALGLVVLLRAWSSRDRDALYVTGVVRVLAGMVTAFGVVSQWGGSPLAFSLPLAALAAMPAAGEPQTYGRLALPALAVLQALHAYPVAGAQTGPASFLLLPVAVVCVVDGMRELQRWSGQPAQALVVCAVTASTAAWSWIQVGVPSLHRFDGSWSRYRENPSLGLPGAARMHLDPAVASHYRDLAAELRARCAGFYGLPGQNSLHFFSGLGPITGYNATAWFFLLDDKQQAQVVEALKSDRRNCIVRDDTILAGWLTGRPLPRGILVDFIEREYVEGATVGSAHVLVRRDGD